MMSQRCKSNSKRDSYLCILWLDVTCCMWHVSFCHRVMRMWLSKIGYARCARLAWDIAGCDWLSKWVYNVMLCNIHVTSYMYTSFGQKETCKYIAKLCSHVTEYARLPALTACRCIVVIVCILTMSLYLAIASSHDIIHVYALSREQILTWQYVWWSHHVASYRKCLLKTWFWYNRKRK